MAQLTLDLPHRPALGRDDFFITDCNAEAIAWLDRPGDWPNGLLIVRGPASSGKSHLGEVWREASGARALRRQDLAGAAAELGAGEALLFDDADRMAGDAKAEEGLFHLVNAVKAERAFLLLTARAAPARWGIALPDLASRLNAAQSVALGAPDDALLQALVIKLFSDRQLRVAPEVITFLISRMERSFAAVEQLIAAIDHEALARKREITVPLARQVLKRMNEREKD